MATKTAIINVRTTAATKRAANKVFAQMGFDMSTGINMYLWRIVQDQAMPFTPRTVNGFTPAQEQRMRADIAEAKKDGKRYTRAELLKEFFP